MTFRTKSFLCRTMVERNLMSKFIQVMYVKVSDIIKEMDLLFGKEEGCCYGMDGCVTPSLLLDGAGIGVVPRRRTRLRGQGDQSRPNNFRFAIDSMTLFQSLTTIVNNTVGSYEMAHVVGISFIFTKKFQCIPASEIMRTLL